jgi:predicted tellurium resistance membrane protein TerC
MTLNEWLLDLYDPTAWVSLVTLVVLEVVLGIDNLIFISILTNKLPEERRAEARQIGMGAAVVLRLALLGVIATIVSLTEPLFTIGGHAYSWRDLVLVTGGLFLIWKATGEIHHYTLGGDEPDVTVSGAIGATMAGVIAQIIVLDAVFSIDSIVTAIGMTDDIEVMVIAILVSVSVMMAAAAPLSRFIGENPTIIMLALGFLLMIGMALLADGMGFHVPKAYIYASMAFAGLIEGLNLLRRQRRRKKRQDKVTED